MSRIKVRQFGPLKNGMLGGDEWIDLSRVTVFIGNQASGKSTVAKLVSTLSWIEKAMVKGEIRVDELSTYNRFVKRLSYQRLNNYFRPDTEIEYVGKAFTFRYEKQEFHVSKSLSGEYTLPKIMYVPAERNFLSVVDRPDKLKELPLPLFTFLDEYDRARNYFGEGVSLPINSAQFSFDRQHKIARITQDDYEVRLSEASSGFQSTVPLYLVTKYLSEWLTRDGESTVSESSIEEQRKVEKEVRLIMSDPKLSPEVRQESLRQLSAKRRPGRLINIVEEPEQNLFPDSQRRVVNELVRFANQGDNSLIITTHSPYLINFLTLAVKAHKVLSVRDAETDRAKISGIVPLESALDPDDLRIYEFDSRSGSVRILPDHRGLPSDENYLNDSLGQTNELFTELQEIERGWR
jgi:predicted ATPase